MNSKFSEIFGMLLVLISLGLLTLVAFGAKAHYAADKINWYFDVFESGAFLVAIICFLLGMFVLNRLD